MTWCKGMTLALALAGWTLAVADNPWREFPETAWKGTTRVRVEGLKGSFAAVVAHPDKDAAPLAVATPAAVPAGLYEVRLTLRPSHTAGPIGFTSGLRARTGQGGQTDIPGAFFARPHEPEPRCFSLAVPREAPLAFTLSAYADAQAVEAARTADLLGRGGPKMGTEDKEAEDALDLGLIAGLSAANQVYYLVEKTEYRPLSLSGRVTGVWIDKIRYNPGDTLTGSAAVADAGGKGGEGRLELSLENGLTNRVTVKSLPVKLTAASQVVAFEITLPREELGYALVAAYVGGNDRSEATACFTVASNFQRVAIFGGGLATRDVVQDEPVIRAHLEQARKGYVNACEYFAWAEDDLIGMTPKTDFWSSGQTNYRMNKPTLQRQIRLAHEQGMAVATYGKYVMSGYMGWETAYDYPLDHRGQYLYPVGMWADVNTFLLDRRRCKDFRIYSNSPDVKGNAFNTWWSAFLPIAPDATPRMVRLAAEECARSIDMFGWDAIRWDGHPRGGGWTQCGRSGKYEAWAARQTQALVRYFKAIVAEKHPGFRHGYNYLLIEPDKGYDWAVEDFELDELCRGGGLLMNESIGNASGGWTFDQVVRNLQADGDLCRERGGYYLGISFAKSPRDRLIESALWAAAGCRPYNDAMTVEARRYCTRYACYTFDEDLRRLAAPEKVLKPGAETALWWQPFVYETPSVNGRRQLVVNLLNIPRQDKRPARDGDDKPRWGMPPGAAPVPFTLTLPAGFRATAACALDPWTLEVTPLPLAGNGFETPAVALWRVVVIDLEAAPGTPSLASLYGPPATLGVPRPGLKAEDRRADVPLDPSVEVWEVNKRMGELSPQWEQKREAGQAALDALSGEALDKALLARREAPDVLAKEWWKGGSLPADLALRDKTPEFGDLSPLRNGRFDVFYGRGAMDDRLRMGEAFAGLGRFRVHDAPLWGALRQGPSMGLYDNVPWWRYPEFDALLFTGIPHAAIGVENAYGLAAYVKAGGGVFFTGGEYAFGKGGYMHTVLEREVLPFLCAGMQDTVYPAAPQPFEPGPDFAALSVKVEFGDKPAFWVRNQVVLKPGARVFLQSGGRPVLVGWQVGKGRVACLLADHRGKSEAGTTAFFDCKDWPALAQAVLAWVAPDAGRTDPPAMAAAEAAGAAKAAEELKRASLQSETDDLLGGKGADLLADPGGKTEGNRDLSEPELKMRRQLIERALTAEGAAVAEGLAVQLTSVANLPVELRFRMLDRVRANPPSSASVLGKAASESGDSVIRGSGAWLLALAADPAFRAELQAARAVPGELESAARERLRDVALAVVLYPKADLVEEGKARVAAWDRQEQAGRADFAKRLNGDVEMLDTSPSLDAEALFARAAWLAYLARHEPAAYAKPFARQWLMLGEYQDYCGRSIANLNENKQMSPASIEARTAEWKSLATRLAFLRDLIQSDMEAVLAKAPRETAAGLAEARFAPEIRGCLNLLGNLESGPSAPILTILAKEAGPDVAAFAAARLISRKNKSEK